MTPREDRIEAWIQALEARHLADLRFQEVSRALRALSSAYVERRARLRQGAALSGAGKRAAFAMFYGPLHFLLVREIVRALPPAARHLPGTLIDLGCGTGAAGAGWALACEKPPRILGVDQYPWAIDEASWTYEALGLDGRARRGDVATAKLAPSPAAVLAAFTANELTDEGRDALLARVRERSAAGDRVLIVEPLARFVTPWWGRWRDAFLHLGGRADEWRFRVTLPPIVAKLDRAAGLDHRELTGRSLFV